MIPRLVDPRLSPMLLLALATAAFAGNVEKPFVSLDLLSPDELRAFAEAKRAGVASQRPGDYAVVFEDERPPLFGAEAEAFFLEGRASVISFGGLINTYEGSMNLGKLAARRSAAPVLAVHSGYGDVGLFTQGPKAFHFERELNILKLPYTDPAVAPVVKLLKRLDGSARRPVTLVGYCLGGLKVANVAYTLEREKPLVLSTLRALVLGIGVNFPDGLAGVVQVAGSRDQFGRINSTNPLGPVTLPGRSHSLRVDLSDALVMPAVDDAFDGRFLRVDQRSLDLASVAAMRPEEREALDLGLAAQIAQHEALVHEALALSNGGKSDQIHVLKMRWELALLRARRVEARLAATPPEAARDSGLEVELAALRAEAATHRNELEHIQRFRTIHSDYLEYKVWKTKAELDALTES